MILNRDDLKKYLNEDKKALGIENRFVPLFGKEIWKFQIALRHYEYYVNVGGY